MELGIGLDATLRLSRDEQGDVVREAARLGYASAWTPAGASRDAFETCARWHEASALPVGISVVPVPEWDVEGLAREAAGLHERTAGRFVLGVGSGRLRTAAQRPVTVMRDRVGALRARVPRDLPLYLAALGPGMLRLAGEVADGAALNWCTAGHVGWSRARIAEGARRAGRDPSSVRVVEYIRVCVDADLGLARASLAAAALGYAHSPSYAPHLERMGVGVDALDSPAQLLRIGYFGSAAGAAAAVRALASDLDLAIVRVVASRPGIESVRAVLRACAPSS